MGSFHFNMKRFDSKSVCQSFTVSYHSYLFCFFYSGHSLHVKVSLYHNRVIYLVFVSGHSLHVKVSLYHSSYLFCFCYLGHSLHVKASLYHNRVIYLVFVIQDIPYMLKFHYHNSYLSCVCIQDIPYMLKLHCIITELSILVFFYSGYSFCMLELCESGVMLSYLRNMAQSCWEHTPTILKTNRDELMKCCLGVVSGLEYLLYRKVHILYLFPFLCPPQRSCRGYIGFTMSVCPSVRPSVDKSYVIQ